MTSAPGGMMPITSRRRLFTSTGGPTIGCPPNALCHNSCDRIATGGSGASGVVLSVSPRANNRPCAGCKPSTSSSWSSTFTERTRRAPSFAVRFTSPAFGANAPIAANDRLTPRTSRYSGADNGKGAEPRAGNCVVTYINRSDCGYGRGRRMTPDTTQKRAAFGDVPPGHDREDGGVRADAERHRENGDRRETWSAQEHAGGEADVPAGILEPRREHRVARRLAVRPCVAEPRPGRAGR